jgi:hypothetical protein
MARKVLTGLDFNSTLLLNGSAGTNGQMLTSAGPGNIPTWTTTTATNATNLSGGAAGQIHYQSAPSTTLFSAAGTSGQILISGGTGSPTWTSTPSITSLTVSGNITAQSSKQVMIAGYNIASGVTSATLTQVGTTAPMFWSSFTITVAPGFTPTSVVANVDVTGILAFATINAWTSTSITGYVTRVGAYAASPANVNWIAY